MSYAMAPAHGSDEQQRGDTRGDDVAERRARARRNAVLLALLAVAFYVGFLLLGALRGFF